jgi:hypothetical protein
MRVLEQTFTGSAGLAAVGWVKGLLRGPAGILEPQKILDAVSPGAVSPAMPETIATWNELTREKLQSGNGCDGVGTWFRPEPAGARVPAPR